MIDERPLLAIVGPTGVGKTALALRLAKEFEGELISADSRQVYRGMDIATGKEVQRGQWQEIDGRRTLTINEVLIHGLDLVDPDQDFSAADWLHSTNQYIDAIRQRSHQPIVVGGTGLYIQALMGELTNNVPADTEWRKQSANLTVVELQTMVQELAPEIWESMNNSDRFNPVRLVRTIELANSRQNLAASVDSSTPEREVFLLGLTANQDELYERADKRVDEMVMLGLIDETKAMLERYDLDLPSMSGIGYLEIKQYLDGDIGLDEAVQKVKYRTHDYIRRQHTWWRKRQVTLVNTSTDGWVEKAVALAKPLFAGIENS